MAVYAGSMVGSFATASAVLWEVGAIDVPAKQVERRTRGIGTERCAERDAETEAYLALPLAGRKGVPEGVQPPELAMVQMDGGRLQILDRSQGIDEPAPAVPGKTKGKHWREDKVGLLASMTGVCHAGDPCPTLPRHFLNAVRIERLVKEIKAKADAGDPPSDPAVSPGDAGSSVPEYEPPEVVARSVVATKQSSQRFGELLAHAAWRRGFYGSPRRAFLGDGSSANWGVWERHFSSFTPIVDFIHALTYVYQGAMAGRPFAEGWPDYTVWIAALWSGDVEAVIAGLETRQGVLGAPVESEAETSPRNKLRETLGYLRNQKERMRYADYRRCGLPITTSHVESAIKQMNHRVKGTEKFWSEPGAEAILQLRADGLSEPNPLAEFWSRRASRTTGHRQQRGNEAKELLSA